MPATPGKSGYVAIVGEPNVGKSTILNYLLGVDLAIVTSKPETTRDKILGTLTAEQGQVNFIDTPGMHIPHTLLGRHMVRRAKEALQEADLILAVIDWDIIFGKIVFNKWFGDLPSICLPVISWIHFKLLPTIIIRLLVILAIVN